MAVGSAHVIRLEAGQGCCRRLGLQVTEQKRKRTFAITFSPQAMGTGYSVANLQQCTGGRVGVAAADVQGEATQLQEVNNYIIVHKVVFRDASIRTAAQQARRRLPHILPWGTPEPELEEGSG